MKKIVYTVITLIIAGTGIANASGYPDLKNLLNGLGGSSTTDVISSVVNGVLTSSNISVSDIVGTWNYVEPAVEFKSDNLLKKAGGAAVAKTITDKITPFYSKANVEKLVFTVQEDGSFKMSIGSVGASGTIEKNDSGEFVFNFKAAGKINIGKINAYMSKNVSGQLTLTFDASKLITLVNTIANISSDSTVKSVSSLLNSYDGLTVGFVLKKA